MVPLVWVYSRCLLSHRAVQVMRAGLFTSSISTVFSAPGVKHDAQWVSRKWIQTQFCFYLHIMWNIHNCPLLLHHFSFQITIYFHPLPSPNLTLPPAWSLTTVKEIFTKTYEVRWFTFIFVFILKFSKSCKLSIVIFHFIAGKLD